MEKYPIDLLKRFTVSDEQESGFVLAEEESEEIELNLGLSLGGRFGIDKNSKKLSRSSSIAGTLPFLRDDGVAVRRTVSYCNLMRTSSLPMEEEWRKRKELQTLRRMAAKRRRSEKQRGLKDGGGEKSLEEEKREIEGLRRLNSRNKQQIMALSIGTNLQGFLQPSSQGGGSWGISELESRQVQGNQDAAGCSRQLRKHDSDEKRGCKEVGMNAMEDMPCVFTKGNGPNGRRVDGILYKYGKGEEVRIMCVCHGSFLTPAEFIKHAGGGDVAHPLKHIVVNRSFV